jgi:hypothetical protein
MKEELYSTGVNHLISQSPLFEAKDAELIVLSNTGIASCYLFSSLSVWKAIFMAKPVTLVWLTLPLGKSLAW